MEFDDFDFDLSVLDDEQTSTKNSSEDTEKLKLFKQLLSSNHTDFDDKLAELKSLLYGELLAMLGECDTHNIHQHHKFIKRTLFEFATAMQTPTFAVISEDILSAYHEFSANDAKNILTHLGVGKHLGTDQNEDFYSLFSNLVCYVGPTDSWQVNIVNREGQATDITAIDSEILYSLFNDQRQDTSRLHQLFTLQIGIPKWRYGSAIIKFIPVKQADISNASHIVTSQQAIEELNKFYSKESNSIPNHPSTLMKAVIHRLQAQVTQAENDCRQDISLLTKSLLNDDNLPDVSSRKLNAIVNTKKQRLTKLQNLSNSLPAFKSKLSAAVNQLIKIVQLPKAKKSLPNDMLWLSLSMGTNNIDELLDQVIGRFVDNYSCEDFDSISSMAEQGHARAQYFLGSCYNFAQGVEENRIKAFEWYRKAAEQGYVDAQYNLGFCYQFSYGIEQDISQAVVWYRKAAEQGHVNAQYYLGTCYQFVENIRQDEKMAVEWYQRAAKQGHADAQYHLANCCYGGWGIEVDIAKAVEWYQKSAEQGNAEAQYSLGNCYLYGQGIKKNEIKAVEYFQSASEQGHTNAQYCLGNCYMFGTGVKEDLAEGVDWYLKAAEQGHTNAQYNLGVCYHCGQGVIENRSKAVEWYRKAAEQGHADAQYALAHSYYHGEEVKEDKNKAVEWYLKAAEQGHADAQYNLAVCYKNGEGIKVDKDKAMQWYRKAAEQGSANAQYTLAVYYYYGEKVKEDKNEAVEWFLKAAEQGHADAQNDLAFCYENGEGIKVDKDKAMQWYRKAAEQGSANAQFSLGLCYDYGVGIAKDRSKAVSWYQKSAEQGHQNAIERLKSI